MTKKGSFLNVSIIPKSLIPECLYQESKLFKSKKHGFPSPRPPGNLQAAFSLPLNASIRGPWFLKTKEKAKAWIPNKRFWE